MEKQVLVKEAPVSEDSAPTTPRGEHHFSSWRPGYFRNLPLVGISALVGVILCACTAVGVLVGSNGKSAVYWPTKYAPHIVLSAINAIANLLLATAVMEGIAIAWWRNAVHGATVEQLHRSWLYTTSTKSILLNFFRLDKIALAALATKLTIADSILLQRATSPYVAQDIPREIKVDGVAATEFPTTGFVVSAGSFGAQTTCDCYMIGDTFTPVVNTWETSNGFFQGYNQLFNPCNGVCYSYIEAIGFEIGCQQTTNHTDLAAAPIAAWRARQGATADASQWTNIPIFNSSFMLSYPDQTANYTRIGVHLEYFQSDDPSNPSSSTCPGLYTTVNCELRPAIVRYPVQITNYDNIHVVNGVRLSQLENATSNMANSLKQPLPQYSFTKKQAEGFEVVSYIYPDESQVLNSTTRLGGIANALSQFMSSSAAITYTGTELWALRQQGTLAQTMMYGPPNMGSCDCSFSSDSLSTVVANINQLTFLTATGMVDRSSYNQTGLGVGPGITARVLGITEETSTNTSWTRLQRTYQIADVTHYSTNFVYMGLGAFTMVLCVLLVAPTFWGYGQIGRKVTMGPMEVAHAFGSPVLARDKQGQIMQDHSIDGLMKQVGDRPVRYGFVEEHDYDDYHGPQIRGQQDPSPAPVQNPTSPATVHQSTTISPSPINTSTSPVGSQPMSPMSPTSKRKSAVIMRMDEPAKVSPAVGKEVGAFSPPTSPQSPSGGNNSSWKMWS